MSNREPPTPPPSFPVNLGWALASVLRTYQKRVEAVLADLPGGSRAFLVMSLVERETCNSQVAIAERLGLDRTTLTYLLDGLETEKLIKRSTDPVDRRIRHVTLTARGAQRLARLARDVERVEREVLSRLSQADAEQFYTSLVTVAGLAESAPSDADDPDARHICQTVLTDT